MHPTALRKQRIEAQEQAKERGISIGNRLGIADAKNKVAPPHNARVRTDPPLAELYDAQAFAEFLREVDEKLEALEIRGQAPPTSLEEVDGITPQVAESLRANGYQDVSDLQNATVEELVAVQHIGQARAEQIKRDVGDAQEED